MRPLRAEAPARPYRVRLSPLERDLVERAAAVNQQCGTDFARLAMLTAAAECLENVPPPTQSRVPRASRGAGFRVLTPQT